MGLKGSVVVANSKDVSKFPKLMQADNGIVVLFSSWECGVVVGNPCDGYKIGVDDTEWGMGQFTDFDGVVELSNG